MDSPVRHVVQNACMAVPGVKRAARRFHHTGMGRSPEKILPVLRALLEGTGAPAGKTVLELGPGQTPDMLVAALLLGASKAVAMDVAPYLDGSARDPGTYAGTRRWLADALERGALPGAGTCRPERLDPSGPIPPDVLHLDLYDGTRLPLEPDSVDVIWSKSVLEHVKDPRAVFKELARVLRPGGVMCHIIDLRDHYHLNPGMDWLRFLRYSPRLWELMTSRRSSWANRLRASEWRTLIEECGLALMRDHAVREPFGAGFARERLTAPYAAMPEEELSVTWYTLVCGKPA
ncbi:MAG TPA: methyltransferase domain-containing protein [bacterium]